jgi:Leucine-rich repeat (LRR) protein
MSVDILGKMFNIETTIELYFERKNLIEFPLNICKLVNLERLYLNNNKITKIPKEICNLIIVFKHFFWTF